MKKYDDLNSFEQMILKDICVMLLRKTRKTLLELSQKFDLDREEFEGSFVVALMDEIIANPNETYEEK